MKIIYISNCISNRLNQQLHKNYPSFNEGWQQQKYNSLIMEGFVGNSFEVEAISSLPLNRANCKKVLLRLKSEKEENITFHYAFFVNIPVIKSLVQSVSVRKLLKKITHNNDCIIFVDALKDSISYSAFRFAKKRKLKIFALYTDVPGINVYKTNNLLSRISEKRTLKHVNNYDGYVFLTSYMNSFLNKDNKPFLITECICDCASQGENSIASDKKRFLMYAGTIDEVYGISNLVNGFIDANIPNVDLLIYGDGDYKTKLLEICQKNHNVKFYGSVHNDEIVKMQKECCLIINPRPSDGEYTKYSFPSKNMEAMASGTPLLGCKLPGIPDIYYKYMFTVDDESSNGFKNKLVEILSMPDSELRKIGEAAKEFVCTEKNKIIQAKRIATKFGFIN